MSVLQASCPSCAGPIEFKSGSSVVVVCPYCRSAVARTDRALEDLGKISEIAQSESPLKVGLKGVYMDTRFELTGRAQKRHQMGGYWDEWYATFSNGWVGWLAEAQGKFYFTFYKPIQTPLPMFDSLQIGQQITDISSKTSFVVTEKGTATPVAAEGEIPYKLIPNSQEAYADLYGKDAAFATIDYSENPPWVFVGKEVTLTEIGLGAAKSAERKPRSVGAKGMPCPKCGGPLELTAPDKAMRIACPYCSSLLDVNSGNLEFFKALDETNKPQFALKLGTDCTFFELQYKIIGAVVRSVTIDAIKYFWHEYLLYNPRVGFRWLIHSDDHWNFAEPINPAEVAQSGNNVTFGGKTYKYFQDAYAVVEYVTGEFYWQVEQGETVRAVDYVKAPSMLSAETSATESNWSQSTFLTVAEVETACNITDLPRPYKVAPNQPFLGSFYYTWGLLPLIGLFFVAVLMFVITGADKTVYAEKLTLPPMANPQTPSVVFSQPFELQGYRNVRVSGRAPSVSNNWVELDVDIVNEQNQDIESLPIDISYYAGVEDGESWSEGSTSSDASISSLPKGKYVLRVEGSWGNPTAPQEVELKVEQNVTRGMNFCCAFLILLIIPLVNIVRKWMFESARWAESNVASTSSSSDDSSYGDDE